MSLGGYAAEDPLALAHLGQQVGLWLFRGFTTRTNRAQNYAVVLYRLHLAELAISKYGYSGDDETRTRLFERFWALATLESRDAELARGDEDAMRGVLGAKRAWFQGAAPLPLDFALISRQNELGGPGELSSLRPRKGLVKKDRKTNGVRLRRCWPGGRTGQSLPSLCRCGALLLV